MIINPYYAHDFVISVTTARSKRTNIRFLKRRLWNFLKKPAIAEPPQICFRSLFYCHGRAWRTRRDPISIMRCDYAHPQIQVASTLYRLVFVLLFSTSPQTGEDQLYRSRIINRCDDLLLLDDLLDLGNGFRIDERGKIASRST